MVPPLHDLTWAVAVPFKKKCRFSLWYKQIHNESSWSCCWLLLPSAHERCCYASDEPTSNNNIIIIVVVFCFQKFIWYANWGPSEVIFERFGREYSAQLDRNVGILYCYLFMHIDYILANVSLIQLITLCVCHDFNEINFLLKRTLFWRLINKIRVPCKFNICRRPNQVNLQSRDPKSYYSRTIHIHLRTKIWSCGDLNLVAEFVVVVGRYSDWFYSECRLAVETC